MLTTSIAMATYNGASHIREQLDSLASQTLLPLELVVTDDGSTDGTLDVVADFAATAPFPVTVHRNAQKLGYKANFVQCAGLCRGDVVAFCDQDDIWDADKLASVVGHFGDPNILLVYHTFRLFEQSKGVIEGSVVDQHVEVGSPWAKVYGITEVFRRSLLDFSDLWPDSVDHFSPAQRMAHDQWIYFLAHAFSAVKYVHSDLLSYRQHDENVCGFQTLKSGNFASKAWRNVGVIGSRLLGGRNFVNKRDELASYWEGLSLGAGSRVALAESISKRCIALGIPAPSVDRVAYYTHMHEYYVGRFKVFGSKSRVDRLSQLIRLLLRGVYWRQGSRGLKDSVVDLVYGVMA